MTTDVLTVAPDVPVAKAAAMILQHDITALPVVDAVGRLLGIVSEDDLVRIAEARRDVGRAWWLTLLTSTTTDLKDIFGKGSCQVDSVMSRDIVTASEEASLQNLIKLLSKRRIKQVPILRDDRLVGIVSRIDILRHMADARPFL